MSEVIERTPVMTIEPTMAVAIGFPATITDDRTGAELHLLRVIKMDAGYDVPVYGPSLEAAQKAAAEIIAGVLTGRAG